MAEWVAPRRITFSGGVPGTPEIVLRGQQRALDRRQASVLERVSGIGRLVVGKLRGGEFGVELAGLSRIKQGNGRVQVSTAGRGIVEPGQADPVPSHVLAKIDDALRVVTVCGTEA